MAGNGSRTNDHPSRFWRVVYVLLGIALALAVPGGLFAVAKWVVEPSDPKWWAMAIAVVFLIGVSLLLFATGPKRATAKRTLKYGSNEEPKTIRYGRLVPEDVRTTPTFIEGLDWEFQRGIYFQTLFEGKDGRWSTSKVQPLMWTYAVLFGLASLILAYWLGDPAGWNAQLEDRRLQEAYLILLGGPFAAAVATKAITQVKVEDGTLQKTDAEEPAGLGEGLHQVVSDDEGDVDLVDTQYFFFNLVALAYFFGTFATRMHEGFPDIPPLLVGLTGVAAATYVAKKAVEREKPSLKSVVEEKAAAGEIVTIWGQHIVRGVVDTPTPPIVMFGGRMADGDVVVLSDPNAETDRIRARVPQLNVGSAPIVVVTKAGTKTDPLPFEVIEPDIGG